VIGWLLLTEGQEAREESRGRDAGRCDASQQDGRLPARATAVGVERATLQAAGWTGPSTQGVLQDDTARQGDHLGESICYQGN
jgi:hypothetical protein